LGAKQIRNRVADRLETLISDVDDDAVKEAGSAWIAGKEDNDNARGLSESLAKALKSYRGDNAAVKEAIAQILEYEDYFMKRSTWIIGGDGWAYDIGYGGLDHVLATGEDVNILVLDTEVYSNTGGQASKSTPTGAIAQFAAGGKAIKKKDLGMMAMSYGYVYVAQVAMGANQNQLIKAMTEAEAYQGPSLIICYCTCINHGIKTGMGSTQKHEKEAVECGYWHLYRYNPLLKAEGKNPFVLDSKEPSGDFVEFLKTEVRYNSLYKKYPAEKVEEIFKKTHQDAVERYESYRKKAEQS